MGYYNRFTFTNMPSIKYVLRGMEYLSKIKSINIDGCFVSVDIQGTSIYHVDGWIDYSNMKFREQRCNCPYINDGHRNCKHIAAVMLYLDLYINGGNTFEMFNSFLCEAIIVYINKLDELRVPVTYENLYNALIDLDARKLSYNPSYYFPYSLLDRKIDNATLTNALDRMIRLNILGIDKRDRTLFSKNKYRNPYLKFFTKYGLLKGEDEYDNEYYGEYYYGDYVPLINNGISLVVYYSLFEKDDGPNSDFYLTDDYEVEIVEPPIDYDKYIYRFTRFKLSLDALSYFINSIANVELMKYLLSLLEDNKLDQNILKETIYSYKNVLKRFLEFKKEYIIGKATEEALNYNLEFNYSSRF